MTTRRAQVPSIRAGQLTDDIPPASILHGEAGRYPYRDSFAVPLQRSDVESWELIAAFFQSAPPRFERLLRLRNRLVAPFGLKTGAGFSLLPRPPFQAGQQLGLFHLFSLSATEAILGEDDRHLDFRISLLLEQTPAGPALAVTTVLRTHNRLGVAYFAVVKPFHRFIVPVMTCAMARLIDGRGLSR